MVLIILVLFYLLGIGVGLAKFFEKQGLKPALAFVPFYNTYKLIEILGRPTWWAYVLYTPIAGFFVLLGLLTDFANTHGKNRFIDHVSVVLAGPFMFIIWAYDKNLKFLGKFDTLPVLKKTQTREWADAIGFAVVAATFIRWSLFEAFTIPTPSMEKTLLVGDYLFVSKFHYGARTPKTPLQVPFTHQKIWGTEIKSYLDFIQLDQYRLPGISHVKKSDIVVFNYPEEMEYPTDLKTNYIKRCVATGGDTLEVRNLQVFINGKAQENPKDRQFRYAIKVTPPTDNQQFMAYLANMLKENGISLQETQYSDEDGYLIVNTTPEIAAKMKGYNYVTNVILKPLNKGEWNERTFPQNSKFKWNEDNYGPLVLPKVGMKIPLTEENIILYGKAIERYEGNKNVVITDNKTVSIDGKIINEYTFKQDYYFMMGDNRHNSLDSRFWGYVPADHVVGKAFMIWLSKDAEEPNFIKGLRFKRIFNLIH